MSPVKSMHARSMTALSLMDAPSLPTTMASPKDDEDRMSAAVAQVFDTVELLEMILLNLPLCDLFEIQRTSTTFRNTIHSSSQLKRHMFLLPKTTKTTEWNPALKLLPFQFEIRNDKSAVKLHHCIQDNDTIHLVESVLLGGRFNLRGPSSDAWIPDCCVSLWDQGAFDSISELRDHRAIVLPFGDFDESRRDMLIAHAPSKSLRVSGRYKAVQTLKTDKDITLGAILDPPDDWEDDEDEY